MSVTIKLSPEVQDIAWKFVSCSTGQGNTCFVEHEGSLLYSDFILYVEQVE